MNSTIIHDIIINVFVYRSKQKCSRSLLFFFRLSLSLYWPSILLFMIYHSGSVGKQQTTKKEEIKDLFWACFMNCLLKVIWSDLIRADNICTILRITEDWFMKCREWLQFFLEKNIGTIHVQKSCSYIYSPSH